MNPGARSADRGGPIGSGGSSAQRLLDDLEERIRRRDPGWDGVSLGSPARVLVETFAECLSEMWAHLRGVEGRLLPRMLETLGEEPRWARPAGGSVVLVAAEGVESPLRVPRGTRLTAPRVEGRSKLVFETTVDAWSSSARLLRVVGRGSDGDREVFPYPQSGWNGEPTPIFGARTAIARHLYLGDPLLHALRDRAVTLVAEWPGVPSVLCEGVWEASVRGAWRAVPVELEESPSVRGRRTLRLRVLGPIPDLVEERIEGGLSPWLRLTLPGSRRIVLPQPVWVSLDGDRVGQTEASKSLTPAMLSLPRAVQRVLTQAGEQWEDHSLSGQKIAAVECGETGDPTVYLGWDRPVPASVFWSLERRTCAVGWGGPRGERRPEVVWEHSSGRSFRRLECSDGTECFTRSGTVSWDLPREWTPQEQFGERLWWVRARWTCGEFRHAPVVRAVLPHSVECVQGRSIEGVLFNVEADPSGRAMLDLVFPEGHPGRFSALEVRREGGEWTKLGGEASLSETPLREAAASEPRPEAGRVVRWGGDRVVLDLGSDWSGAVKVRIPFLRVGLGDSGNVSAGSLSILESELAGIRGVLQPLATDGGLDPEMEEAFLRRIEAEWRLGRRVVTLDEVRTLLFSLDPEIGRVEASVDPDSPLDIVVTVIPTEPCAPGRIASSRLAWFEECLSEKLPLGSRARILEAIYVPIEVRASRRADGPFPSESVRVRLEESLRRFLHPLRGGLDGRGAALLGWLSTEELRVALEPVLGGGFVGDGPSSGSGSRPPRSASQDAGEPLRRSSWAADSALRSLSSGSWDPRAWRFEVTSLEGARLPLDGTPPADLRGLPAFVPVLERLVFETAERPERRREGT